MRRVERREDTMKKFSHIGQLYQAVRYVEHVNGDPEVPERYKIHDPVNYRGSVKLHGACCGAACTPEAIVPQSKTIPLIDGVDFKGFARFLAGDAQQKAVREIEARVRKEAKLAPEVLLTLFGEWCGPGVEGGMGISLLPEKQWVLFSACVTEDGESRYLDVEWAVGDWYKDARIFCILDIPTWEISIDLADKASVEAAAERIKGLVQVVEDECPWAKRFGFSGIGEGIVWMPQGKHFGKKELAFKVKGPKHTKAGKKDKVKVKIAPDVLASIDEFVAFAVSEERLAQGLGKLEAQGLTVEKRNMGAYLKWLGGDVQRECALDLEASGLEWKQVAKAVTTKARDFFLAKAA